MTHMQVDVQLTRTGKVGTLIGPQGYGKIPTLTELRVQPYDSDPSARCKSSSISATDDSTLNGGAGGAYENAVAGVCTGGASVSLDDASYDSDTQEADALIATGSTTGTIIVR